MAEKYKPLLKGGIGERIYDRVNRDKTAQAATLPPAKKEQFANPTAIPSRNKSLKEVSAGLANGGRVCCNTKSKASCKKKKC